MKITPLNGEKTHPLSEHAIGVLRQIQIRPRPCYEVNPGVRNRLLREDLVEVVLLPSPFALHKSMPIDFFQITEAGRAALEDKP